MILPFPSLITSSGGRDRRARESAKHFFAHPHVIVNVGGQDIKIILLRDGAVRDFKLNTQCSAGNGFFLQSTAEGLGIPVENYAEAAFSARAMPTFG